MNYDTIGIAVGFMIIFGILITVVVILLDRFFNDLSGTVFFLDPHIYEQDRHQYDLTIMPYLQKWFEEDCANELEKIRKEKILNGEESNQGVTESDT